MIPTLMADFVETQRRAGRGVQVPSSAEVVSQVYDIKVEEQDENELLERGTGQNGICM